MHYIGRVPYPYIHYEEPLKSPLLELTLLLLYLTLGSISLTDNISHTKHGIRCHETHTSKEGIIHSKVGQKHEHNILGGSTS